MATHSSILAWEIPWEDPIIPWGHKRVRYDLATKQKECQRSLDLCLKCNQPCYTFKKAEMGKFSLGSSKKFLRVAKNYDFLFSSQRGQIIENNPQATNSKYTYSKEQLDLDSILKTNPGYLRANKGGKKSLHNIQLPLVSTGDWFQDLYR